MGKPSRHHLQSLTQSTDRITYNKRVSWSMLNCMITAAQFLTATKKGVQEGGFGSANVGWVASHFNISKCQMAPVGRTSRLCAWFNSFLFTTKNDPSKPFKR